MKRSYYTFRQRVSRGAKADIVALLAFNAFPDASQLSDITDEQWKEILDALNALRKHINALRKHNGKRCI